MDSAENALYRPEQKVRLGEATGTVAAVRNGSLEVFWDTGARSRVSPREVQPAGLATERSVVERERRRREAAEWRQRKRDEQLRREWEAWRYQRSKLPAAARGPMMEVGQRECRHDYCRKYFKPTTLAQRYCRTAHARAQRKLEKAAR